jgi:NADH-quinone oxidoreductase subunit L
VLLGLAALTIGWVETPDFLGGANGFAMMLAPATGPLATPARHPLIALAGIGAPFVGIAVAYGLYRSGFWRRHAAGRANYLTRVLQSGFGFDAAYDVLLTRPFLWLVKLLRHDPVDFCALALEELGGSAHRRLRALQGGRLRRYAGWLMAGSVAMIAALLFA